MKKIILLSLAFIALFILSAISYVKFALPSVNSAPELIVDKSAESIARG